MKLRSCSLMIIFFAANVYKGQTTEYNNSRLKQKDIHKRHVRPKPIVTRIYPEVEKPVFKIKGRKISETKCLEYFWERNNLASDRTISSWSSISSSVEEVRMFEVGGREALLGEFPHMGALGWETIIGSWIFKCGTSLISHKFTLTAAHCSKIRKDRTLVKSIPEIVRLGENNIIDGYGNGGNPIDADILRIIVHPRYLSPKKYYDIALVEFKSELQFSRNVQPLCLWDRFDTSTLGTVVSSTGWGVVDTATKLTSPTLQTTVMDIINSDHCNRLLRRACNRRWCGVRKHQLCAGKLSGGVDACQGDSGGPLQVTINLPSSGGTIHYLVGITSFGIGCARPNLPGVYTRVSSFVDWIESIVWPNQ